LFTQFTCGVSHGAYGWSNITHIAGLRGEDEVVGLFSGLIIWRPTCSINRPSIWEYSVWIKVFSQSRTSLTTQCFNLSHSLKVFIQLQWHISTTGRLTNLSKSVSWDLENLIALNRLLVGHLQPLSRC
jgi:hypothetical protein